MQRWLIQCANGFLVVTILIGIPAITSARLGSLQLLSVPKMQMLTLWGLALAAAGNLSVAVGVRKPGKERSLCWRWAFIFGALLLVEYLYFQKVFTFGWLKEALLWLQGRL